MLKYCEKCGREVETHVISKSETLKVKDLPVSITSEIYVCNVCGNELWDDEKDEQNLKRAFDVYRVKNHLLTSDEIKAIRAIYGVSQKNFSIVLGFGEKTITRYENGSLQDVPHNSLLILMKDARNFKTLWEQAKNQLPDSENIRIENQLKTLEQASATDSSDERERSSEEKVGNIIFYDFHQLEEM
jgi:putative zinc finger/helix-turn-helix YgiT family protein